MKVRKYISSGANIFSILYIGQNFENMRDIFKVEMFMQIATMLLTTYNSNIISNI